MGGTNRHPGQEGRTRRASSFRRAASRAESPPNGPGREPGGVVGKPRHPSLRLTPHTRTFWCRESTAPRVRTRPPRHLPPPERHEPCFAFAASRQKLTRTCRSRHPSASQRCFSKQRPCFRTTAAPNLLRRHDSSPASLRVPRPLCILPDLRSDRICERLLCTTTLRDGGFTSKPPRPAPLTHERRGTH